METAGGSRSSAVAWVALAAALAALGVSLWKGGASGAGVPRESAEDASLTNLTSLENRVDAAEGRLETAEKRLLEIEGRLTKNEKLAFSAMQEAQGATALAKAAGGGPKGVAEGKGAPIPDGEEEKAKELQLVIDSIRTGTFSADSIFNLLTRAKDLGGLDRALAEVEKFASVHPTDPGFQVALGTAYAVKLYTVAEGPERGVWASRSLESYENALKIDPANWDAQFLKGFNLSQWPAFLGRQPEAIRTLEKLVEQQERATAEPKFAQTYFHLGNLYQSAGNADKAKDIFKRGLDLYPDNKPLREKMDVLEKR